MCRLPGHFISLFCLLAFPAFGQIGGVGGSESARFDIAAPVCSANGAVAMPAQIQPYTAELKTTTVQLLANGATIRSESREIRAVDSQLRTLTSMTQPHFSADQTDYTHTFGNVDDPVEGTQITWDSLSKTARVIKLPPESQRHGCWATDSGNLQMSYGPANPEDAAIQRERLKAMIAAPRSRAVQPKIENENLGTMTIEGVEANGDRTTTIIPVGQIGNDRELVTTTENWYAPSLGLAVRQVTDDPQRGKTTTELTRLDLSEPPLATFQPPEEYAVTVEELHQVPCQ